MNLGKSILPNSKLKSKDTSGSYAEVVLYDGVNEESRRMTSFLEKLTEVVLPKLRDFSGFTTYPTSLSASPSSIQLNFDSESWTAFPEIEASYLKFPQFGSVGCLQPFSVTIETTARDAYEARLLMSGYRIPFSKENENVDVEEVKSTEFVHEL